ncbi:MAG: hypothetical protein HEQ20_13535 [Aphanizomenon flos-aquae KM1D3_PB]|uniref:hypothetical protein n=1 Tax=Aphanizomenon flos-aquae TaxID=1176 RepID=UPI0005427FDE|nr:hypothetical protein [Aphanizomenon flos-aquae]KHG40633.1 hypothetical protein OA07_16365 [Aphanizomenon flos-aquae 2012/KM1/D3]QSV71581.1 MAG: hypothetical protein HEQ20_13535 [Aphanizomenon flos-aquae KM1D3_PB]
MMENVLGCQLNEFLLNLTYIVYLSYFDGSLLSVFKSEHGDFYIYNWCDVDNQFNRWLVFRVKRQSLIKYLEGELSGSTAPFMIFYQKYHRNPCSNWI